MSAPFQPTATVSHIYAVRKPTRDSWFGVPLWIRAMVWVSAWFLVWLGAMFLLPSCAVPDRDYIPGFYPASQVCEDEDCPAPSQTAEALWILTREWNALWDQDPSPCIREFSVEWLPYDDRVGLAGLTKSPSEIQVHDMTPGDVAGSALVHESIHACVWYLYGDPDAEHESEYFDSGGETRSLERIVQVSVTEAGL